MAQPPRQSADGRESSGKVRHLYLIEMLLGAGLLLLVIAIFVSNNNPPTEHPSKDTDRVELPHDGATNVVHLTSANWQKEVVESQVPVVVDFWAPWCGPCRDLAPVISRVATRYEGKIKVGKLNIDEASTIASRYGIQSIPQVYVFHGGEQPRKRIKGFNPSGATEAEIISAINSVLQ